MLQRCTRLAGLACGVFGPLVAFAADQPAVRSSASDAPRDGVLRAQLALREADGARVALVFFDLRGGSESADGDLALRQAIERVVALAPGDAMRAADLGALPARLDALDGVRDAGVSAWNASEPGSVVVVVTATLEPVAARIAAPASVFPVLHQGERSILRVQLSGGAGVFSDHNPWFGAPAAFVGRSPIAIDPPGAGWTTWAENSVEYGLAGAFRLGEAKATAFGEVTAVASSATGNDLFRSDTRTRHAIEKAYAGMAWLDRESGRSIRLSSGRQNWQLNGGFLFSRFAAGSNAGPSPGLYLSPRTTYQRATLADLRWGRVRAEAFDLDPTELEGRDSGTRYLGFNLRVAEPGEWEAAYTRYQVPESRARIALASGGTAPRQGMRAQAVRLGWQDVAGLDGIDVLGEFAAQDHRNVGWDARAWYAQVAWRLDDLPWRPNLAYRRAVFSGDDPATPAQEAFDAQLSSGLDEWVQGVSFKKVVSNSNLATHRVRLNAGPRPERNWTLDLFRLDADQPTASGARHYGDEVNLALRWSVSPRVFVLGVAGLAWPGEVIRERSGGDARRWATVQASVFWGL